MSRNSSQVTAAGAKVAQVITSCYTIQQLEVAERMMWNFYAMYYSSSALLDTFKQQQEKLNATYSTTTDDGTEHF